MFVLVAVLPETPWLLRIASAALAGAGAWFVAEFLVHVRRWRVDDGAVVMPAFGASARRVPVAALCESELFDGGLFGRSLRGWKESPESEPRSLPLNLCVSTADARRWLADACD